MIEAQRVKHPTSNPGNCCAHRGRRIERKTEGKKKNRKWVPNPVTLDHSAASYDVQGSYGETILFYSSGPQGRPLKRKPKIFPKYSQLSSEPFHASLADTFTACHSHYPSPPYTFSFRSSYLYLVFHSPASSSLSAQPRYVLLNQSSPCVQMILACFGLLSP